MPTTRPIRSGVFPIHQRINSRLLDERVVLRGLAFFCGFLVLLVLFPHRELYGQGTRIVGQVRIDAGQEEKGGATVEIYNSQQMLANKTVTDTRGQFYFAGIATDRYTIVVSKPGFQRATETVNVAFNLSEQYVTVFIVPQDRATPDKTGGKISAAELSLPPKVRQEFDKGREAIRKEKYQAAIRHLEAVTAAAAQFPLGYEVLGVAYYRSGDSSRAEAAFQKALELDSNRGECYFQLGLLNYDRHHYDESRKNLETGLRFDPGSVFGHYQLGLTFFALEKYSESERELRRAQELDASVAEVHVRLANIHLRKQNPARALAEFETYLRKEPQGPFAARVRQVVTEMRNAGVTPSSQPSLPLSSDRQP